MSQLQRGGPDGLITDENILLLGKRIGAWKKLSWENWQTLIRCPSDSNLEINVKITWDVERKFVFDYLKNSFFILVLRP